MIFPSLAIIAGLLLLIWSADRFVDSAAAVARHFGMPQLLIGIVIIGFGTSAPEMIVSAISAINHNPGIALGNAYGSNITNIALILGCTALISPLAVNSQVLKQELPMLLFITAISAFLIYDASVSRTDAFILLLIFILYMGWSIWHGLTRKSDTLVGDLQEHLSTQEYMPLGISLLWLFVGLLLLMGSSQLLVWGAVEVAKYFGISDLVIGLTIVAIGTSLPELASSLMAARKGEVDLAVGNIIGSNLFNTLAVVGIAGAISPIHAGQEVFSRDMLVMSVLTVLLLIFGFGKRGRINRFEGLVFLLMYIGYNFYLFKTAF
ncbi:calcium/sodium antiporter [Actinobacillus succinogenes]|uniref:Na+/Ca+ antiporter, CaCA family n=1 Tax=Actinobacillus succinogenes (strain ATCC 55618 / DSM 22257 / CCUG 43843 / 130Z) TaxID=339671 RepID=A6VNA9_ACTSZ|nr:calcium/sodium antiporter [Actinobacillus succinogenes]ABR74456.1 Na+/Ca+ antiporter, CaCA family [Actinobacillus succinogenes 130Z]PHI41124.1 calcium/sodium antiporter [Actinobacillus succinogenes]